MEKISFEMFHGRVLNNQQATEITSQIVFTMDTRDDNLHRYVHSRQ